MPNKHAECISFLIKHLQSQGLGRIWNLHVCFFFTAFAGTHFLARYHDKASEEQRIMSSCVRTRVRIGPHFSVRAWPASDRAVTEPSPSLTGIKIFMSESDTVKISFCFLILMTHVCLFVWKARFIKQLEEGIRKCQQMSASAHTGQQAHVNTGVHLHNKLF